MSILVSGVLMDPAGRPISEAQITLTAIANSLSVLNGFSATVETDSAGHYGITLAVGSYSIGIAAEGRNHIYGAITLDDTTGPSTLNQLLKQQIMESEVTPDVILYFRQIQQQVANDLSTVKVLEGRATDAAGSASASRDAAQQYATGLAEAVASAKAYRDQAERDAVTATLGAASATLSKDAATVSQQASAQSENNARQYRDEAKQAATTAAEDASTRAAQQAVDKVAGQVKADADRAVQGASTAQEVKRSVDLTAQRVTQQHGEAVQAASNAKASETHAANSAGTATNAAGTAVAAKDEAAGSAQNAANSAGGSQVSATQAAGSAGAAAGSAVTAKQEADRATAASEGKLDKTGGTLTGNTTIATSYYPKMAIRNTNIAGNSDVASLVMTQASDGSGFIGYSDTYSTNTSLLRIPKENGTLLTAATGIPTSGGSLTGTLSSNVVSLSGNVHFTGETGHSFVSWRSSHTNLLIDCPSPYQAYTAIRWTEQNVRHLGALHCHAGGNTPNLTRISFSVYNTDDCHRFFADRYEVGVPGKTGSFYNDGNVNGTIWGGNLSEYFRTDAFRRSRTIIGHVDTPFSGGSTCGVFKFNETLAGFSGAPYYGNLVNFQSNMASGGDTWFQLVNGNFMSGDLWIRSGNAAGSQSRWFKFYSTGNTTVDANGFIKQASPIIRLFDNARFDDVAYYSMPEGFTQAGSGAVNGEAKGVVATRISEGVYQVTGAQGFALEGWQIELPTDDNRQPLIWAEREVDESGVITIRTYHREHPNSPPFAQNKRDGYGDGQPVDIPHGRWVDLRLEMAAIETEESE